MSNGEYSETSRSDLEGLQAAAFVRRRLRPARLFEPQFVAKNIEIMCGIPNALNEKDIT